MWGQIPLFKRNCKNCSSDFFTHNIDGVFCTRKCLKEFGSMKVSCQECNQEFHAVVSAIKIGKDKFCSRQCYLKSKLGKPTTHKNDICCCTSCKSIRGEAYYREYLRGKNSSNWRGGNNKCLNCKKVLCNRIVKRCQQCYGSYVKKLGLKKGENNPSWGGGKSFINYPQEFNKELKEYIRNRDYYICKGCLKNEYQELYDFNIRITVHHIDYNKQNCHTLNLITTCGSCNSKANFNKEYWEKYFHFVNLIHYSIFSTIR